MTHYKSNIRDIEFNLFEVLSRGDVLGHGPYAELDADTARSALGEVDRLAREQLADSFVEGDRTPPVFDPETHSATLPKAFKRSYAAYQDAEWWRFQLPTGLGGQPAPPSLQWSIAELVLGANPAIYLYASGTNFAHMLWRNGTERDRKFAQLMVDGGWTGTMQLTEPDAGSDVGAGRTKAIPQPDGSWHLEGVKRFITSAEHDLTDQIVHFVLARPVGVEGAGGPGTKGLSLFVVPKFHVDLDTGELGGRNGVYVTGVEHKMGLKVSTTCEVTFGEHEPAVGWLLGEKHDGIAQMFQIIEHARMVVGTKAIATLSTGYLNALEYAKQRVQGADLTQLADKTAPRVTITHHPDVRRSLMTQKAFTEALRALMLYTASVQDTVALAESEDRQDLAAHKLNDLLLPLVKGYGSERSWTLLGTESLQTLGGSGFLSDYPLEQYVRDAKIDTLYEGTTAIQGQDLFFRKIVRDRGETLGRLSAEIVAFLDSDGGNGRLKEERELLRTGLADLQTIIARMTTDLAASAQGQPREVYKVGLNTSRLLVSLGDVVCSWLMLRQADVALTALDGTPSAADRDFYTGKVAAARWFVRTTMPGVAAERVRAELTELEVMDLDESAF